MSTPGDSYEDDEPLEDLLAIWENSPKQLSLGPSGPLRPSGVNLQLAWDGTVGELATRTEGPTHVAHLAADQPVAVRRHVA